MDPRLHRSSDDAPGIRRRRSGRRFTYRGPGGKALSPRQLRRVQALAVPPAWRDVWISPDPRGHVQATGKDARGRKQYIYHGSWRRLRDGMKFDRLEAFGQALPDLRDAVQADLRRPGLPHRKVTAAVVRIMERSFIRVGSRRYARDNGSFGASTLEGRHVAQVSRQRVRLRFRGKGGKRHEVDLDDPRVAAVVRRCRDLPGQRLFEYEEDGEVCHVGSTDVNDYLREAMGAGFTSKDLRTWSASVLMLHELLEAGPRPTNRQRMRVLRDAVKQVARRLDHTVAVCKRSYIHPAVPAAYFDGSLEARVGGAEAREGLWPEEERLLRLLRSMQQA